MTRALPSFLLVAVVGCGTTDLIADARADPAIESPDTTPDPPVDLPADPPRDPPDWELPACTPRDEVSFDFEIYSGEWWSPREMSVETECRVEGFYGDTETVLHLELSCEEIWPGAGFSITELVIHSPPYAWPMVVVGQDLTITYIHNLYGLFEPIDQKWIVVRGTAWGGMVLAGVRAASLAPPGRSPEEFYSPRYLVDLNGVCAAEEDDCGIRERHAIGFEDYLENLVVLDGQHGATGSLMAWYTITVEEAREYHETWCTDVAPTWFSVLVVYQYF
jgi:hypothetical protein